MVKKEELEYMKGLRTLANSVVVVFILISCDNRSTNSDLPMIVDMLNEINDKSIRTPQLHFTTNGGFLTSLEIVGDLDHKSILPIVNLNAFKYLREIKLYNCVLNNIPELNLNGKYKLIYFQNIDFKNDTSLMPKVYIDDFLVINSNLKMIHFRDCNIINLNLSNNKFRKIDLSTIKGLETCILVNNQLSFINFGDNLSLKKVILSGNNFNLTAREEIYSSIKKYSPDCNVIF